MSKIIVNQDIEIKWGGRSNDFKTIIKQDTERSLVHGANEQINIWK